MSDEGEDSITVAEAAQILGVSEETVRRRVDDGSLRGWRTKPRGGWRRVSRSSVEEYRRAMRGEQGSAPS